jgi:hypothetical protein
MDEMKIVRDITEWNPTAMRSKGHPKNRWGDDVLRGLKKLKVKNWTCLVPDRKLWYELVQKKKNPQWILV